MRKYSYHKRKSDRPSLGTTDHYHSDHDQGGQKGPFWDLSQGISSSMHSISLKFCERSGNGQT